MGGRWMMKKYMVGPAGSNNYRCRDDMRGWTIEDVRRIQEKYNRGRAQFANHPAGNHNAEPERDEQKALVAEGDIQTGMVHSDRPLIVRITRVGGRTLDTDNLAGGCKELRDAVAAAFDRKGDSTQDGFTWEYEQKNRD